jgi:ABC-2 type transport system ATP-binding protein
MSSMRTIDAYGPQLEVTLNHPAAAFAAMLALEGMSEEPPHAQGTRIVLSVPERAGAVMEAARRLTRAGVSAHDIVVRAPALVSVSA